MRRERNPGADGSGLATEPEKDFWRKATFPLSASDGDHRCLKQGQENACCVFVPNQNKEKPLEKIFGSHTVYGTASRRAWLQRMVEGVITQDGAHVAGPDGVAYQLKGFLVGHVQPEERVLFVPRDGVWGGRLWAAEVWRGNKRKPPKRPT